MRVLICDDEPDIRTLFRLGFELAGAHEIIEAADGAEAIRAVADASPDERPDMVVLDLYMPVLDGLAALPRLRELLPGVPIVVVSAHAAVETYGEIRSRGATACFEKVGFHGRIPNVVERFSKAA